jgi:GAF domain-containing protein
MAKNQVMLLFDHVMEDDKNFGRLVTLSDFLSQPRSLQELLDGSLQIVLNDFDLETGRIYLPDPIRGDLYLAAHKGLDISGLERVQIGQGFTGKAAEIRSFIAYRVEELEDKARARLLQDKGLKIVYCVPFVVLGKVEGVMNLGSKKDVALSLQEMKLLFIMGHQIGIAIAYSRLYDALNEKIQLLENRK